MQASNKCLRTFWLCVGFVIVALAGFAGMTAFVGQAISKVASGRGLETFRTVLLVEFNYIGVLVMLIGVVSHFWARMVFGCATGCNGAT